MAQLRENMYPFFCGGGVIHSADGTYYLRTAKGRFKLSGFDVEAVMHIVRQFDGSRMLKELVKTCIDEERIKLMHILAGLRKTGLFIILQVKLEGIETSGRRLLAHLGSCTDEPAKALQRVREKVILMLGKHPVSLFLSELIHQQGFMSPIHGESASCLDNLALRYKKRLFVIVVGDEMDTSLLEQVNEVALDSQTPWTAILFNHRYVQIGPWVYPGETACYKCFHLRHLSLSKNFCDENDLKGSISLGSSTKNLDHEDYIPVALLTIIGGLFVQRMIQVFAEYANESPWGRLTTYNIAQMELTHEIVRRVPLCPVCSNRTPPIRRWVNE